MWQLYIEPVRSQLMKNLMDSPCLSDAESKAYIITLNADRHV